ncbi:hypothetical protein [Actinomycetospora sp. TBRC 11914]|uniref:hypothetical protein n=1 Tax=Actinomycetospora sp. TBRC 11914 TaxID=2729387 RepID=UPI00145D0B9E|nr:hypothetical protein [Actinomycetospora sp. TBRC 11914]NMO92422.1 hypothetical protein [Actinomycetospora sp. TBRC 11914]
MGSTVAREAVSSCPRLGRAATERRASNRRAVGYDPDTPHGSTPGAALPDDATTEWLDACDRLARPGPLRDAALALVGDVR